MKLHLPELSLLIAIAAISGLFGGAPSIEPTPPAKPGQGEVITIDPFCKRSIEGICDLRRETYFGLCDTGENFIKRCKSDDCYTWLIHENGVTFGRRLSVVNGIDHYDHAIREDSNRPGFVDLNYLREKLAGKVTEPNEMFSKDVNGRLEIAAHEEPSAFPDFMGRYQSKPMEKESKPEWIPENVEASAELIAATLHYKFSDFDRPSFYEPINEPHWSYWGDQHFADWHLAAMRAVHKELPGVMVGGPCLSIVSFSGLKKFITNTGCNLDFYSFHVYDFLKKTGSGVGGQINSGLALESSLDLVQNFTLNTYGKKVPLVMSEHGGYGPREMTDQLAEELHFPEQGFDLEMKKLEIHDFNQISSTIANTLTFMDHPKTVLKAVPFILLDAPWDPKYRSVLFVPKNYTDKENRVPTKKILFYRLFRDLKGRRVVSSCVDPDIQTRAFVDGSTLFVVLNNLSETGKPIDLKIPEGGKMWLRRLGRTSELTPYFTEEKVASLRGITLKARETLVVKTEYETPLTPERQVDEISFYGDKIQAEVKTQEEVTVNLSHLENIGYASLRIGVCRDAGLGSVTRVIFNGKPLNVPRETCTERLAADKKQYSLSKIIPLDPACLKAVNRVELSFPDGKPGTIESIVIRAAFSSKP